MARFYLRSNFVDGKDYSGRERRTVYKVEDVASRGGKLMTTSGVELTPLPRATPAPVATEPPIEPTPLPLLTNPVR
jgi:hypothetical protein